MNTPEELQAILDEANSRGSLIEHHPDLKAVQRDSRRDLRYQPIRFHDPGKLHPEGYKPKTGYGLTEADIEAERDYRRNQR